MSKGIIGQAKWITVRITLPDGSLLDSFETNDEVFADERIAKVVKWYDDAKVERTEREVTA